MEMYPALVVLSVLISTCSPVPVIPDHSVLNIHVEEVPQGIIGVVNTNAAVLQDAVAAKSAAVNGLVDAASTRLYQGVGAVSSMIAGGINTASDTLAPAISAASQSLAPAINVASEALAPVVSAASEKIAPVVSAASERLTPAIESLGRGFTLVSNGVTTGIKSLGDSLSDRYVAAGRLVADNLHMAGDLVREGTVAAQSTVTRFGRTVSDLVGQQSENIAVAADHTRNLLDNPFAERPRKLEMAILEQEDPLSKVNSVKDNLQQFVAGIFNPEPVVDNIQSEDEKFGNDGEGFSKIGKILVGTTEGIANFFSNAVNFPFKAVTGISNSVKDKFNNLGGRLIGI